MGAPLFWGQYPALLPKCLDERKLAFPSLTFPSLTL